MSESTKTDVAVREPHYAGVTLHPFGNGAMPALQSLQDVVSIAQLMSKSQVAVPKHLRENPGACFAVTMQALRWNADAFAVANKSYSVNDRLAYEAQLIAAVIINLAPIKDRPSYEYERDGPDRRCFCIVETKSGKVIRHPSPRFADITPKNSPLWKSDPDQQQAYYTIRAMARLHFPDIILGIYDPEEMASEPINVTPQKTDLVGKLSAGVAEAGFDRAHVAEQLGEPDKPRGRKKPAEAATAPEAEVLATPVAETEPEAVVDAEVDERPTSAEAPTETAGAPTVEPEAASQDSATSASTVTPEEPEAPSLSPPDGQDADPEDVVAEGFPEVDEIYHLVGDAWEFDDTRGEDRRDTYKNGQPFSDAGRDKGYAIYEDGGVLGGVEAAPAGVVVETSTDLPPDFEAYVSSLDTVTSWAEVKTALQAFMKGVTWHAMPEDVKNRTRANTWFTLVEERKVEWLPSPAADVSAYRMWMETEQDAALVQSTFDSLTDTEAFKGANDATRQAIISATAARIDHLKG